MKTYAHHNANGSITALITLNAPDGAGLSLNPKPGTFVTEIEEIKLKSNKPDIEELREIIRTYRISSPLHRSALTKKQKKDY